MITSSFFIVIKIVFKTSFNQLMSKPLEAFIKYFSECAMAARGWSVLAWDTRESRLWIYNADAHNQGGVWGALPIIVLDVYEHAYFMDYGADRKAYLKAFWKNFNWSAANDLYKRASSIRL